MAFARRRVPELMDDPGLDAEAHRRALRGLARLNALSRVDGAVWGVLSPIARRTDRRVRLLDVGAGAGDMAVRLARRASREDVRLEVHACDISDVALASAVSAGKSAGFEVMVHRLDVLREPLPAGFDVAYSGLFLHHFDPPNVERVLGRMREAAACVLVQDLCRTRLGLAMAWTAPRLVTRSRIVHEDAVRSARAAYTTRELEEMGLRAGLTGARVTRAWPERQILLWEREA
jgi:SAM-dependent methyltransferase